jgi:DNA helicase II / ATP-dependent DNA helicase PcrA
VTWDEELSEEQRFYASSDARIQRLVAGPGTGKTRVMTRRVAYLIEEQEIDPSSILALTFSRAAARELRQRLEGLLGEDTGDRPGVFTLHAFALRQLLRTRGAPTLPHPIRIADDYDERWVVDAEIAELAGMTVRQVQREFRRLASDWETLTADEDEWERKHPNPRFLGAWRSHREIYGYTLRSELVYALKKALDEDPDLELEPAFRHVLADEYQDLNRCELAVVERLVRNDRTLFVAGDDDQSIYGFRNAFPLGLREFDQTYPEVTTGELVECHRCDSDILRMALNVAEQDVDRIPKDLRPLPDAAEGQVEAYGFGSISHEARGIAQICRQLIDEADVAPGSILILLRNDPRGIYSQPIVDALTARDLEAELPSNPFAILEDDLPRQLVCVLRLLRDGEDGLAWRELIQLRGNGLGAGSLMAIYRFAYERGVLYYPALRVIADDPDAIAHPFRRRMAAEVERIEAMLEGLCGAFESEAAEGLAAVLDALSYPSGEGRDEVEGLLLGLLRDEETPTLDDVEAALHSSRGAMDEAERTADPDRIQIMTMHTAKGLTADAVIVAACDDQLVPGDTEDRRELDDQRRLLYVSLTRARHFLFVTYARRRAGQQSHVLQVSEGRDYTRFLRDYLPPQPA